MVLRPLPRRLSRLTAALLVLITCSGCQNAGAGPPDQQQAASPSPWQAQLPAAVPHPARAEAVPASPPAMTPMPVFIGEEESRRHRPDRDTGNAELTVVVGAEIGQCTDGRLVVPAIQVGDARLPAGDPCPAVEPAAGEPQPVGEPAGREAPRCDAERWRCRTGPDQAGSR